MLIFLKQRTQTANDGRINGYQSTKELTDDREGRPETQGREEEKENREERGEKREERGNWIEGGRGKGILRERDERPVTACGRALYSGRSLV